MTMTKVAMVFPGQGSQTVGMLADIAAQYPEVLASFAEASQSLGYDLWKLVKEGPQAELDKTMHTQPALLAASIAIWRILETRSRIKPLILAGHSLGEYSALVAAGSLAFADAVQLVAARGELMQAAVAEGVGAMAAIIGLDEASVAALCEEAVEDKQVLSPANFNSVGQVVIAGHKASVEKAMQMAKAKGAKLVMLIPVSVPSHCELMRPASEHLAERLAKVSLHLPRIPVVNNVDARPYQDIESIRAGLAKQLFMPVRWVETIQYFVKTGITEVIECGPGKILSGLNKRIDKNLKLLSTADLSSLEVLLQEQNERNVS